MSEKENAGKGKDAKSKKSGKDGKGEKTPPAKSNVVPIKKDDKKLMKTTVMLRYNFTEPELKEKAQLLGETIKSVSTLQGELASIKKDYGQRLAQKQVLVDELSDNVTQKYEMRNTPCFMHKNFKMKERQYLDLDGQILKTEPLTTADYQLAIDEA